MDRRRPIWPWIIYLCIKVVYAVAPSVTSINPTTAATDGSSTITILGSDFGTSPTASVGGQACQTTTLVQAGKVTCLVPVGIGSGKSVVVSDGVTTNGANTLFTYKSPTITSVSPTTGYSGDTLTLNGSNFGTTSPAGAGGNVGGPNCAPLTWISNTVFTCVVASNCGGEKTVQVTVSGQASATGLKQFSYHTPTITSIIPSYANATGGETITIQGNYYGPNGCTSVGSLNGYDCTTTVRVSDTELTCESAAMYDTTKFGVVGAVTVTTSAQVGTFTGITWLYDECTHGNHTCGNSTCTDTPVSYTCATDDEEEEEEPTYTPEQISYEEGQLTSTEAAASTATVVMGVVVVTSVGNMAMAGSGAAMGGASGSAMSPSSLALIEQIQFLSTIAALDVRIPSTISAFAQSLQWSNGMVTQYVLPAPILLRRRLLGASDATGMSVEETFFHQLFSSVIGGLFVMGLHFLVIYLMMPLFCKCVLRKKRYKIDPALLFPSLELLMILTTFQGITLVCTTVIYNASSVNPLYTTLAVLIMFLYCIPLPFVIIAFVWISLRTGGSKYTKDPLPNWIMCIPGPLFIKNYFFGRGHWEGDPKFIGRFGALFSSFTHHTRVYMGFNMLFKLCRCIILGLMVGFLEGKFQIASLMALHTTKWLWVCLNGTSSNRLFDWQTIGIVPVEIFLLGLMAALPNATTPITGSQYQWLVQTILFTSMFLIYSQIIPMLLLTLMQAVGIVWNKIKMSLMKRNVPPTIGRRDLLHRRRSEMFIRIDLHLDPKKYTLQNAKGEIILDPDARQQEYLMLDECRRYECSHRISSGKTWYKPVFSYRIYNSDIIRYVDMHNTIYTYRPTRFTCAYPFAHVIPPSLPLRERHSPAGILFSQRRHRMNWGSIDPRPVNYHNALNIETSMNRPGNTTKGVWDVHTGEYRPVAPGESPCVLAQDDQDRDFVHVITENDVYFTLERQWWHSFATKKYINRRLETEFGTDNIRRGDSREVLIRRSSVTKLPSQASATHLLISGGRLSTSPMPEANPLAGLAPEQSEFV
jgi:hypothetical protein